MSRSRTRHVQEMFSQERGGSRWDDMYSVGRPSFEKSMFQRRCDFAVDLLRASFDPTAQILDLGCGAGPFTADAERHEFRCVASDLSMDMILFARDRLNDASGGQRFVQSDSQHLPFDAATFDGVVSLGMISYVPDRQRALSEIHRVLRPGGMLVITYRNFYSKVVFDPARAAKFTASRLRPQRPTEDDSKPGTFLKPSRVRRMLEAEGFHIEMVHGIGFGPIRLRGRPLLTDRASARVDRWVETPLQWLQARGLHTSDVVILTCRRVTGDT